MRPRILALLLMLALPATAPAAERVEVNGARFATSLEADGQAFALVGHLGQYVIVSPEQGLTVVRLGKTQDAGRAPVVSAVGDIFELYPAR